MTTSPIGDRHNIYSNTIERYHVTYSIHEYAYMVSSQQEHILTSVTGLLVSPNEFFICIRNSRGLPSDVINMAYLK